MISKRRSRVSELSREVDAASHSSADHARATSRCRDRTAAASVRRWAAGTASASALGLASAHLVVTLDRFPQGGGLGRWLGRVLTPTSLAALLAVVAAAASRERSPGRVTRFGLMSGATVMWVLAVAMLGVTVVQRKPMLVRPDGPGLWSLVGAPAFTVAALTSRR